MNFQRSLPLALATLAAVLSSACSNPGGTGGGCDGACIDARGDSGDGSSQGDGARDGSSHADAGRDVHLTNDLVSVRIMPADSTLAVPPGQTATLAFHAIGTFRDGTSAEVQGSWALADDALGAIGAVSGIFTANGARGGVTQVQFRTTGNGGGAADTGLTVTLSAVIQPPPQMDADGGTLPGPDALFAGAGPPMIDSTAQPNVLYPLDRVMFPQNITAPLVQWSLGDGTLGGTIGDWYRITYVKPHATVTQYVSHADGSFNFAAALPDDVWARVAETDPDAPATLSVDRLDVTNHRVVSGNTVHMNFARGSVSGTVYYWAMDEGRLHRVPAGTTTNEPLFPSGIVGTSDTAPSYTYGGCIACHQISRDGRYLAANGDASYVFDLSTADPTQPMTPVRVRPGYRWYFSTISPDNRRIFATMPDTTFGYTDLMVNDVAPTGAVPTTGVAHPSWSPDGHTVAYISNVAGWTSNAEFSGGDLTLVDVDTQTDAFSNQRVIHAGSSLASSDPAGGNADCFPSWTPDSRFLVFAHTPDTRGTGTRAPGSLFFIQPTPGATPVRLANATDDPSGAHTHYPNVSPFSSGGFYWVVFYSDRDYGNSLAGTRGASRPQLWVSAISETTAAAGGSDPSNVPYWLPGQDVAHQNADAVWAASACRMTGDACRTSADCCSGACQPTGDGGFQCVPPPTCRREGESCERDADCCGGMMLYCDPTIRTCQMPLG